MGLKKAVFLALVATGIVPPVAAFASDVGMVAPFVSTSCPAGWIQAGTRAFQNQTPQLYAILHKTSVWGSGSQVPAGPFEGTPDIGGNFIRGWSATSSTDTGRQFGSGQSDQFQGHYHNFSVPDYARGTGSLTPMKLQATYATQDRGLNVVSNPISGLNGFPRYGDETRPVNIALLYCIKAVEDSAQGETMVSTFTLVEISTTAAAQMNPGIWQYFNGGDISFWTGVLIALVIIWGYRTGLSS